MAQQHGQIQLPGRDLMQALFQSSLVNSAMSDVSTTDVVSFQTGDRSSLSYGGNGLRRRARNKVFQRLLSDRRSKHIPAQTDHKVEGQDVHAHCRRWCLIAHDGESTLFAGNTKTIRQATHHVEIQTASGIVRSTKEGSVHIHEFPPTSHMKLVEIRFRYSLLDDGAMS